MRTTAKRSADDRHDLIRAIDRLATEVHDAAAEVHDAIDRLAAEVHDAVEASSNDLAAIADEVRDLAVEVRNAAEDANRPADERADIQAARDAKYLAADRAATPSRST